MAGDPVIALLGAYRLTPVDSLFAEAMEVKYGALDLAPDERSEAERAIREELASVFLFEVLVSNRDHWFDASDFGQNGSNQAAYDERYLSADGENQLAAGFEIPRVEPLRMAFYLHFVNPALPIETSYGPFTISRIAPIPLRLQKLMPYEPLT